MEVNKFESGGIVQVCIIQLN